MKKQYPNDGKLHPDLSDFWQEVVEAARPLGRSTGLYLWVFAGIVFFAYPDGQTIVGWGLVLLGLWGFIRLRASGSSRVQ